MENGFAEMRLNMPLGSRSVTGGLGQGTSLSYDVSPPQEEEIQDAKMASRSWYEPEKDRIVVFDLNDSDAESESGDTPRRSTPSSKGPNAQSAYSYKDSSGAYSISQSYLDRIPAWPYRQPEVAPLISATANPGALVLYKTPAYIAENAATAMDDDDEPELFASIEEVDDDDDTQMMELDDTP